MPEHMSEAEHAYHEGRASAEAEIAALRAQLAEAELERDELAQTQAVCHCGILVKDHDIRDGHVPLGAPEMPSYECVERLRNGLAEATALLRSLDGCNFITLTQGDQIRAFLAEHAPEGQETADAE